MSNDRESNEDETHAGGNGAGAAGRKGSDVASGVGVDVESQVATLTAERDELKDRMLRIAAEFENWKKRARKEQDDGEAKVRESVLKDVLDVMDNLERAVSAYGDGRTAAGGGAGPVAGPVAKQVDGAAVLKGVSLVLRLFQTKLDRYGVKPIVAEGQPFDPHVHEAISRVERADLAPGIVAAELQRGYRIGERLLRPSLVSVATGPTSTSTSHARAPEGGHA